MADTLSERSLNNLVGVHPDLVRVVSRAAALEPFIVTEGIRNLDRQKQLVAAGKSWTLNSRHLTGHAVDLCDPDGAYDIPDMDKIRDAMFAAAAELKVPLEWGGDWKVRDTPHFQLPFASYPASGVSTSTRTLEAVTKIVTSRPFLTAVGGGTAYAAKEASEAPALAPLPAPPDLSALSAWQQTIVQARDFAVFATEQWPWVLLAAGFYVAMAYGLPYLQRRFAK